MVRIRLGSTSAKDGKPTGLFGRIGATLFFGVFLGMSLLFCGFIAKEVADAAGTYRWTQTPCSIEHASVATSGDDEAPYGLTVAFTYEAAGQTRRSDRYSTQPETDDDYTPLARLADALATDLSPVCYVNPDDPNDAILSRPTPWIGLFILIPLIFVAVGGGGIYATWFGRGAKAKRAASKLGAAKSGNHTWIGVLILTVVAIAGLATGWFMMVMPIARYVDSSGWVDLPCVIESSKVRSHSSDDGTTYSIDILYRYEIDGRVYRSNRYNFFAYGSSSGRSGKSDIVRKYPRGAERRCLVDPDDPYSAVLDRGLSLWALLMLIPVVLLAIGFGGLYAMARSASRKRDRSRGIGERRTGDVDADAHELDWLPDCDYDAGPVRLKPTLGRFGKLVGVVFFATFWNGIVSIFVYQAVQSHLRGNPEWFLTIFMVPFVLVGLVAIGAVVHQLLALLNPRVELTVSSATVTPGEQLEIAWDLVGRVSKVKMLRITFEGREEATYTRGTNTVTDKNTFATFNIVDTDDSNTIDTGRALLTLPRGAIHSFEASNNKIIWSIKVRGEIRYWPDINSQYTVVVRPVDPHAIEQGDPR